MTRLANEIRPAEMPMYCSACGNQDVSQRHVDFDAACDRGFGEGTLPVAMDDLILCEKCVKAGGGLVGMEDRGELAEERDRYKRLWVEEVRLREKAEAYANRMEEAIAHRPQAVKVSKPRGRPSRAREEMVA